MKQIIFEQKKIYYDVLGKGKPVMLLHGFGENHLVWAEQIATLKDHFKIILPDIPGSGRSEILDGDAISVDDYALIIRSISEAEKISPKNKFTLIGHSMGGYITLAFAEKFAELLNGFGLFHSTAYADDEAKISARKKGIDFIKKNGSEAFLKTTNPNLFAEKTKRDRPGLIQKLMHLSAGTRPEALTQYHTAMMMRPDRTLILRSFKNPVLFIIGKNDNAVPLEASLKQSHMPEISYVRVLENSGHMGMWEEAEKSTQFLMQFIYNVNQIAPMN
jgi:pimeloyl-ACP methyl ester carboxylesterase